MLHPAGAFTGATEKCGYYAEAYHSSLFIDEITSLSLSVQAKLLCVLDSGYFSKAGSMRICIIEFQMPLFAFRNFGNNVRTFPTYRAYLIDDHDTETQIWY